MASGPCVLMCGLPGSGNGILMRCLAKNGVRSFQDHCDGAILAGGHPPTDGLEAIFKRAIDKGYDPLVFVIVPVRAAVYQRASVRRRWDERGGYPPLKHLGGDWVHWELICRRRLARFVHEHGLPLLLVSYEGFVQDPEATATVMLEFLGLDGKDPKLPETIVDGNEKYRHAD